jgi:hypothetical protein
MITGGLSLKLPVENKLSTCGGKTTAEVVLSRASTLPGASDNIDSPIAWDH